MTRVYFPFPFSLFPRNSESLLNWEFLCNATNCTNWLLYHSVCVNLMSSNCITNLLRAQTESSVSHRLYSVC